MKAYMYVVDTHENCLTEDVILLNTHMARIHMSWRSMENNLWIVVRYPPYLFLFSILNSDKMSHLMTKPKKWVCAQQRLCPVWSESSLSAWRKTLIKPGGCPGWSESSLGVQSFCWFCHIAAQITVNSFETLLHHMTSSCESVNVIH